MGTTPLVGDRVESAGHTAHIHAVDETRAWYKEPETFIALAALVVSVSAVAVGLYEASLQREHDRNEVWPHVEIGTYTSSQTASIAVANTGIGPAVIDNILVSVDGRAKRNWKEVLGALTGSTPKQFSYYTVGERALRAGDKTVVVDVPGNELPPGFWDYIGRVGVTVCYHSVFNESWIVDTPHLGGKSSWRRMSKCAEQPKDADF